MVIVMMTGRWFQLFSIIFYVHPYLGKIPILTNIFQMGWFNHQLDDYEQIGETSHQHVCDFQITEP